MGHLTILSFTVLGIDVNFYKHDRHGYRISLPPINNKAQASVRTDHENSFKIKGSLLWNLLPKGINSLTTLGTFKAALWNHLKNIPDTPPVPGYTAANRNSLLDWNMETGNMGGRA